ncbi:hypothetical protein M0Q97_06525 [Candidatus Dojkabacteria bacterium]|jgi:hypothetical protein|nr:hypothetical protein [Candidatus Dojkabacteria bacterium]
MKINNWKQFLNENLTVYQLNTILDKMSKSGLDSLSNHEKKLLKSYSDKSIDAKNEIQKHINKYQIAKNIIKTIPLQANNEELEENIGRYVKFKKQKDWQKLGLLVNMGMIFEIVSIQKHWGYVNDEYVSNKIGYRIAEVGEERDFGRVGDVDEIEFVNITEDEAININQKIRSDLKKGIYPKY